MRKSGFKWFLPLLFCVCMVAMMAPAAFAADASVSNYDDLVTAIANAKEGDTITLGGSIEGDVTIPSGKNIVLDLGGNTLTNTNAGKATLFVENGAVATVKNGTITGGTSYYNIAVGTEAAPGGELTLEKITATAGNSGSSMIDNWGTLYIKSGSYTGGLNVVKSELAATLTIDGGSFELTELTNVPSGGSTAVVLNYGTAIIRDGEFTQKATTPNWRYPHVIMNAKDGDKDPHATIYGGNFTNKYSNSGARIFEYHSPATSSSFEVMGGTCNKKPISYCIAEGYSAIKVGSQYICTKNAASVSVDKIELTLIIGETATLTAEVLPDDVAVKDITWSTTNSKIASVSSKGIVTAKGVGTATITATAKAGGAKATCTVTVKDEVAAVGETTYPTLSDAIDAAQAGDTITLLKDVAENIVISSDKEFTLDLNGKKLTNISGDTIINHGKIEIIDKTGNGVVDNITNAKAAIKNDGTVVLHGGTYTRSKEAGKDKDNGGGNSYYTILNDNGGSLTIYDGVTVYNDGHFSSMIRNGGTAGAESKLTIIGGTFSGGINTVKNDESGYLNISGGDFSNTTQYVVMNWHKADISGDATFAVNDTAEAVLFTSSYGGADTTKGELTISGGYFKTATDTQAMICDAYDENNKGTAYVSGGYFNKDVAKFCVTGLTAVKNTESNANEYPYKVGEMPANDENVIKQADAVGATTTDVSAIPAEKQDAATAVAKTVTPTDISTDKAEVSTRDEQAALTELAKQKKISLDETGKVTDENVTVTIIKQAYLDVAMTAYDVSDTYTVGMDITPRYSLVAVATTGDEKPEVENGYTIASEREMTVTEPTEITVQLPIEFAGKTVYITHEYETGKFKYYTATAAENGQITFVTDGFSPFTFTLTAPDDIVAVVGGVGYTSFADAVAAANDGDTVILKKAETDMAFTFNTTKTIYIENQTSAAVTIKFNGADKFIAKNTTEKFSYTKLSGGSSASTGYKVTVAAADNGGVTASPTSNVAKGATVTITVTPDKGYKLDKLTATDNSGKTLTLTKKNDTTYTFTMPALAVKVSATFVKEPTKTDFNDVADSAWYADAVQYAVDKGMMNGIGNNLFAPEAVTNRGMIVTVLYRLDGEPNVSASSFVDVAGDAYYAKAVAWANANGIVNGYGNGKFGPNDAITREQFAAILYRYAQYKDYDVTAVASLDAFSDAQTVSAYAVPALRWAVGAGVVNGSDGKVNPQSGATRAQAAQLLMNFCENVAK